MEGNASANMYDVKQKIEIVKNYVNVGKTFFAGVQMTSIEHCTRLQCLETLLIILRVRLKDEVCTSPCYWFQTVVH